MNPKYEHDCDECIFLGHSADGNFDLYIHPVGSITVIACRSSDPPDYKSGLVFVGMDDELTQAYNLAKIRNLIITK